MNAGEMDQIAKSFQNIQFLIAAIIICMILYLFVLIMVMSFIMRKRRIKVRSIAPAIKRQPQAAVYMRTEPRPKPAPSQAAVYMRPEPRPKPAPSQAAVYMRPEPRTKPAPSQAAVYMRPEPRTKPAPSQAAVYMRPESRPNPAPPQATAYMHHTPKPKPEPKSEPVYELAAATGNLFAEALKYATGADIAILNSGGIRSPLVRENITEADIAQTFPFSDTVTVQGLTKAQIKAVLEHSAEQLPQKSGRYLMMSGIVAEFDSAMPTGERVVSITLASGEPLSGEAEYIVAANDYIANGGDGYDMLAILPKMSEEQTVVQAVLEYISEVGAESLVEYESIRILNAG